MEELFKSSIVKGFVLSVYGELGPTPIYCFPDYYTEKELKEINKTSKKETELILTMRDITQISIKNLSLFISDKIISQEKDLKKIQYFAILPYPDFNTTSLTYFHFIRLGSELPVATAFSILVEENSRSFLYNNMNRIKPVVYEFFKSFDKNMEKVYPPREDILQNFYETKHTPLLNIGCGEDRTIKEIASIVSEVVGYKGDISWDQNKPDGTPQKLLDISQIKRLGWKPKINLKNGIRSVYEWYLKAMN